VTVLFALALATLPCSTSLLAGALRFPLAGLGICICCLIVYLRLEPSGAT